MTTALLLQYGIPVIASIISALFGYWHGKRSTPSLPKKLGGVKLNDPVVQLVLSKLVKAAHDSGHAALDSAVMMLLPGLTPLVPEINKAVDTIEARIK